MKATWMYGALTLGALMLASLAEPVRGLAPDEPHPIEPQQEVDCDEVAPCEQIEPGAKTITLQPHGGTGCGECIITPGGKKIRNTTKGSATIKVKVGEDGEITEVDLGDSGHADYEGDGGTFKVTGGNAAFFSCYGSNNTVEVSMGGNSGGGDCDFYGNGNTVTNVANGGSHPTSFTSWPENPGESNAIHLGGESGEMSGPWTYF